MRALTLSLALFAAPVLAAQAPAPATPPAPAAPAAAAPAPCASAEHRQFDFWLGDWAVSGKAGQPVGRSHVESILGGCVLAEHWTSATGNGANDGKSYNLYNAQGGQWEQFWVDAGGTRLLLAGSFAGNAMVLEGRQLKPDPKTGIVQRERITWTANADGSVRQLWQSSTDEGKTWNVAFDGMYTHPAQ